MCSSRHMKNSVYDIFEEVNETIFPNFKKVYVLLCWSLANIFLLTLPFTFIELLVCVCFVQTTWLECTQDQNEIIFVPSGWYHQVYNLVWLVTFHYELYRDFNVLYIGVCDKWFYWLQEDTISINHNWFNAYNVSWVVSTTN